MKSNLGSRSRRRIGLIVNPIAGLGGRVGLKGSDGEEIQRRARDLGAHPQALDRTAAALRRLQPVADEIDLVTCPGAMGEEAASRIGLTAQVLDQLDQGSRQATNAEDTRAAARAMVRMNVDLILFAGGDGTARDLYEAVGEEQVVLGIPAGVKIHSAAFAVSPAVAGSLAASFLTRNRARTRTAEVLDADESSIRRGMAGTVLRGVLRVPDDRQRLQGAKALGGDGDAQGARAVVQRVADELDDGVITIVGPGTTTRALFQQLGLKKTLLGVDVLRGRTLLASDAGESKLLELLAEGAPARILVTPIGGQGYLFGRGNQQISPAVLQRIGPTGIQVIATPEKLNRLIARPLLVDTGDETIDRTIEGHVRVLCGPDDVRVVRVAAASTPFEDSQGDNPS